MEYINVAQLDGNKVVAVSMLKKSGFKKTDNQVIIAEFDESLIGKKHDAETGKFVDGGEN